MFIRVCLVLMLIIGGLFSFSSLVLANDGLNSTNTGKKSKNYAVTSMSAEQVSGIAQVIKIEDSDEFWITILNNDKDDLLIKMREQGATSSVSAANGVTAIRVQLRNVKTPEAIQRKNLWSGMSPVAKSALELSKNKLLNKEVVFICQGVTERGLPLCSIYIDRSDFAYEIIMLGYSKYSLQYGEHPTSHSEYLYAEKAAEEQQIGIWTPYYYFIYPDE